MSYKRFAAMIAISTAVMLGLMYLNTYALDHVFYSQTRTWMAVVMGAAMAPIVRSQESLFEETPHIDNVGRSYSLQLLVESPYYGYACGGRPRGTA